MVLDSGSVKLAAMRRTKGFSLIELLIVVAIILIIAAIAIPNLLRARIAANESSAVSAIRSIATAEFTYNTAYPTVGYATALANLGGPANCIPAAATACMIDSVLSAASPGAGSKGGYVFLATGLVPIGGANTSFVSGASPVTFNISGVRDFCSTEDGVMRFDAGAAGSTPVNTVAGCQAFTLLQ